MGSSGSKPAPVSTSPSRLPKKDKKSVFSSIRNFFSRKECAAIPEDLTQYLVFGSTKASRAGGFSDVFEATLNLPGRRPQRVAVKVLRAVDVGNLETPAIQERLDKRLQREMRIWKPLEHPRIVSCLGFATYDNRPALVSPWCKNGNAREYLAKHPKCNRKALIAQVAQGLIYLHSRSIVHHDIKSLNILIDGRKKAMLTDFGIARILDDVTTGLTTGNATVFTMQCAAPESLEGKERTTKSDVFSFACFALEMMTGKAPFFDSRTPAAIMMARNAHGMPTQAKFPELPATDPLWGVLERCWARNPEDRPNMNQVLQDLQALGYKA